MTISMFFIKYHLVNKELNRTKRTTTEKKNVTEKYYAIYWVVTVKVILIGKSSCSSNCKDRHSLGLD